MKEHCMGKQAFEKWKTQGTQQSVMQEVSS